MKAIGRASRRSVTIRGIPAPREGQERVALEAAAGIGREAGAVGTVAPAQRVERKGFVERRAEVARRGGHGRLEPAHRGELAAAAAMCLAVLGRDAVVVDGLPAGSEVEHGRRGTRGTTARRPGPSAAASRLRPAGRRDRRDGCPPPRRRRPVRRRSRARPDRRAGGRPAPSRRAPTKRATRKPCSRRRAAAARRRTCRRGGRRAPAGRRRGAEVPPPRGEPAVQQVRAGAGHRAHEVVPAVASRSKLLAVADGGDLERSARTAHDGELCATSSAGIEPMATTGRSPAGCGGGAGAGGRSAMAAWGMRPVPAHGTPASGPSVVPKTRGRRSRPAAARRGRGSGS